MCNFKKAMAILLVLSMALSFAFAMAETKETKSPIKVPEWHASSGTSNDTQILDDGTVAGYLVNNSADDNIPSTATLIALYSTKANANVVLDYAFTNGAQSMIERYNDAVKNDEYFWPEDFTVDMVKAQIAQIGDGTNGVLSGANGKNVASLTVNSTEKVTIAKKAFSGSKATAIVLNTPQVAIKANAFNGSKAKTVAIAATGAKTCDDVQINKKAFNKLKKVTIKVSKANMSAAEYQKLKKKLKKKFGKKFGKSIKLQYV